MKRMLVGALLVAVTNVAGAQESVMGGGKPSVFHLVPYAGYMVYGDHFETTGGLEYSNDNSWIVGAQAGFDLSRNFSLVGNFGWSKTNWEFEGGPLGPGEVVGSDVGIWVYDANLQFRAPFIQGSTSFSPFVQAGAGAIKFSVDDNDFESDGATNVAFNVGLGADMQFMGVGLRLMAKDYMSSFQWDELDDVDEIEDPSISHNWALTVGLKFGF